MTVRTAACRCGRLTARCEGEPVRVSVCHCNNCRRRSGSLFAAQARWPDDQVEITGESREWTDVGETGGTARFRFCPDCGSTVSYSIEALPGLTAIAMGAFAGDADNAPLPTPQYQVFDDRCPDWLQVTGVEALKG
jgi:hypothetical protein